MKSYAIIYFLALFIFFNLYAQTLNQNEVPAVYSNIHFDSQGKLFVDLDTIKVYETIRPPRYTLEQMIGNPKGTDLGIGFNFNDSDFKGRMNYGFIDYFDSDHPLPVYHWRTVKIDSGKTNINIKEKLTGNYDMIGWQKTGKGTIGYRIADDKGNLIYDGIVSFRYTDSFKIDDTIIEGPFVNKVTDHSVTISFETNNAIITSLKINNSTIKDKNETGHHEFDISNLKPETEYLYTIFYGGNEQSYSFKTSPKPGSRKPFVFSFACDSRSGAGGGERDLYGANYYIMKKIMALVNQQDAKFMQFTGDMISGYLLSTEETDLQYANWKRAIEPFAHYIPVYVGIGNHEAIKTMFSDKPKKIRVNIEKFPFDTKSAEIIFANNFVNPNNGLATEDGNKYDPNPDKIDFPSYEESVYHYTYDNVAMIVLNSNYWYVPSTRHIPLTGGNPHAYIMDNQLEWLNKIVQLYEKDENVDHVFVTLHTPFFPNGGHSRNDMWYSGNNNIRAHIAGKSVEKGIIERRDELLEIIVNKSSKVRAILTGDEHNYNKMEVGPKTNIYPEDWNLEKINLSRTIYQINNGAAGAPYYAQEQLPWTPFVTGFTTQNAVVFFHVDGSSIIMKVLNPDTLEEVDNFELQ